MLFLNADVEVAARMMRAEEVKGRAIGHGRCGRHHLGILVSQFDQGFRKYLSRCVARRRGFAGIRIIRPEPMKLLLLVERRLEAPSLLGDGVEQDRRSWVLKN